MEYSANSPDTAFCKLLDDLWSGALPVRRESSRVGDVLVVEEPITLTYLKPRQRVMFNPVRDANPFFHLFESLWMLAGRNDVAPLAYYNSKIAEIASDDGKTFNGAYGWRWRRAGSYPRETPAGYRFGSSTMVCDQLETLIHHLQTTPNSRRAVLQMWNVSDDLLLIDRVKDVCCNLCVMFSSRKSSAALWKFALERFGVSPPEINDNRRYSLQKIANFREKKPSTIGQIETEVSTGHVPRYLDMTVCNRSNDLVWGMLGANVVHFSFLQEYVANSLGMQVGVYQQFTNNLHIYTDRAKIDEWLKGFEQVPKDYPAFGPNLIEDQSSRHRFDNENRHFVSKFGQHRTMNTEGLFTPFLQQVAWPMCAAFEAHKARDYNSANLHLDQVAAKDWQLAGRQWIERRHKNWEQKQVAR